VKRGKLYELSVCGGLALFVELHLFAKRVERAMLNNADGRHALPDDLGHLAILEVFDEAQNDHASMLVAQAKNRLADPVAIGLALQNIGRVTLTALVYESLRQFRTGLLRP
jgi:hypothetical protein